MAMPHSITGNSTSIRQSMQKTGRRAFTDPSSVIITIGIIAYFKLSTYLRSDSFSGSYLSHFW